MILKVYYTVILTTRVSPTLAKYLVSLPSATTNLPILVSLPPAITNPLYKVSTALPLQERRRSP